MSAGHRGPWVLVCVLSHQTVCDPVDCSLPDSSLHGISQGRIAGKEWVTISSSRGSSQPRDQTHVSCAGGWVLYLCATWEAQASTWNTHKGPG